ncbi:MAG: hypothetical protein RL548_425, partial [Bacteroidota bacterium]
SFNIGFSRRLNYCKLIYKQKEQRKILNSLRLNKINLFWDNLQLHRQSVLDEDSIKVKKM